MHYIIYSIIIRIGYQSMSAHKLKCTIPHRYMIDWSKQECNT